MVSEKIKKTILEKNVAPDILGQEKVKEHIRSSIISDRHILIIGPPGIGKTTLAKDIAKILPDMKSQNKNIDVEEQKFVRIQGSPDLTAEDMLGDIDPVKALKFGPLSLEAFSPGKIFKANNGLLFFDEINRCPEKLQNALLQVLEERKATIASYDVDVDANFILIATMNPEDTSTEKLSDGLLDRFDVIYMGYPESLDIEKKIVLANGNKILDVDDGLLTLMIDFVRNLRDNKDIEKHPSVRASLGLYERSQANALLKRKKKADFQDLKDVVVSVISHRIRLKPNVKYLKSPEELIQEEFSKLVSSKYQDIDKGDGP